MLKGFWLKNEQRACLLRQKANLPSVGRIDPLNIARLLGEVVIFDSFSELPLTSSSHLEHEVSALTVKIDGRVYVVQNDKHSPVRRRVSLMEEFAHILLGHIPSSVSLDPLELLRHRTYNTAQEKEAYALGAATLVPYTELRRLVLEDGTPLAEVASYYEVSYDLVAYRLKTTYVWRELKAADQLDKLLQPPAHPL